MKGIVIGLGSMGKRRLRILSDSFGTDTIVGVDMNSIRCQEIEAMFGITTYSDFTGIKDLETFDYAFVCTSPLSHAFIIKQLSKHDLHVFTELNLSKEGYQEIAKSFAERGKCLFLSSTMLYRKEIRSIEDIVHRQSKQYVYQYHVGQYLPDWHPWESYKDFFVADPKSNGCRELMAIEFPWLIETFGQVVHWSGISRKISDLDLSYDDVYQIQLVHDSGHVGMIQIDLISRVAVRRFSMQSNHEYVVWEGTPDTLKRWQQSAERQGVEYGRSIDYNYELKPIKTYDQVRKLAGYNGSVIEDPYLAEVEEFFKMILDGKASGSHSYEANEKVIDLIDEIEAELENKTR